MQSQATSWPKVAPKGGKAHMSKESLQQGDIDMVPDVS